MDTKLQPKFISYEDMKESPVSTVLELGLIIKETKSNLWSKPLIINKNNSKTNTTIN